MTNPFHSFHIQKGGVPLKKLSKHYNKITKNKTKKFQPLMEQEREDLVVPMDLIYIPSSQHPHHYAQHPTTAHRPDDYYIYPEQQPPIQGTLEIVEIHKVPLNSYEHPSVIDDNLFEEMFQNISTTPRSKNVKASRATTAKQHKLKRKTKTKKNKN